jgi:hypothetical protein
MPIGRVLTTDFKYQVVSEIPSKLRGVKWGPFFVEEIENLCGELAILQRFKISGDFIKGLLARKERLTRIISPYFASGIFKLETTGVEDILNKVFNVEKVEYYADVLFNGTDHKVAAVGYKIEGPDSNVFRWIPLGFKGFYLRDFRTAFYLGKTITL